MWGSMYLGWTPPEQVLLLLCLLIKAVCFLLCPGWGVWSVLSRLLELLSKCNLNLKIAVGLLKPHFSASSLLLKLFVLRYLNLNPPLYFLLVSQPRDFAFWGQDVSIVPGSIGEEVVASYSNKMLLQPSQSGGCFPTFHWSQFILNLGACLVFCAIRWYCW